MESQGNPFNCPFCTTVPCLPPFNASNGPNFTWGSTAITGPAFCEKIDQAYEFIVHWKHNLFLVPYGSAGSHFVTELAKLYESFGSASAMECIALKAAMVLPALLLQKPHIRSKSRENINCLERHLHLWHEGDIDALLVEGYTIQRHLQHSHRTPPADSSCIFACLVFQGKIKAAMRFLTEQSRGSFLPLSTQVGESTVFDELVKKHPDPSPATPLSLINPGTTNLQSCDPVIFNCLDGDLIRRTAVRIEGFARPSEVDALGWRCLCTSFRSASLDLCHSLALVARRISTSFTDLEGLQPLLNCRLIALDKNPGV